MANLKEIRNRITSVSSTMQITNAMKMVSAAKLKKAQDAITQMRPYATKLRELMEDVTANMDAELGNVYTVERPVAKVLLIAVSSNRGLAGAFNTNIIKEVNRLIREDYSGNSVDILTIGKKANDILERSNNIIANDSEIWDDFNFSRVSDIADMVMQAFANGEYDTVKVIYNHFKNAGNQIITVEDFLPILIQPKADEQATEVAANDIDYIFEPNKEEILEDLIPKTLKTQLFKALLDSRASEHGARMTAMHKATDNADELRKDLRLVYNKARQAAITKEILEIVGGADALDG